MKTATLKLHTTLIICLLIVETIVLAIPLSLGTLKPYETIEVLDIVGEGAIMAITVMWIIVTFISRPAGKVTNWLIIGLAGLHVSVLLDFLDEFFKYTGDIAWLTTIESLPAPFGMILMSIGLYYWHQEQVSLNAQLSRRERFYREHKFADAITSLYGADYMLAQIQQEIDKKHKFSLLMLDIDRFDNFIRLHGDMHGDRLLREIAELIVMNIRTTDLACRYAGDRFIVMLPNTSEQDAIEIGTQIEQSIAHLAFKTENSSQGIYHSISVSACTKQKGSTVDALLTDLNHKLESIKRVRTGTHAA